MSNAGQKDIIGKSAGEIARDIEQFLSRTVEVQARRRMDLANLLPPSEEGGNALVVVLCIVGGVAIVGGIAAAVIVKKKKK